MAITISQDEYWALFQEEEEQIAPGSDTCGSDTCGSDAFDVTWKYPELLGQGYWREIQLQQGVCLAIARYELQTPFTIQLPEREHVLEYSFCLSGGTCDRAHAIGAGQYVLYGSGIAPIETTTWKDTTQIEVTVHLDPQLLITGLQQASDQVPPKLEQLVQPSSQSYYTRSGIITSAMHTALQQILSCPFRGATKRMYLESKVWELMALLLQQELETVSPLQHRHLLKPDDVERIHQAKEILLQQLDRPPSLLELARQVGLNDCTLKRGFRQVFGQTAFGCLHDHRLEQARQLLEERRMNVSEVSQAIGFANRSYFAAAFRKKFGVSPREYLSHHKNSA